MRRNTPILAIVMLLFAPAAWADTVALQAPSTDGLTAAIASAGPGGTILVKAGLHTESGTVFVSTPVNIIGESGAVLESGVPFSDSYPIHVVPALHIRDTDGVTVQGIEIRPPSGSVGGTAVLIERASDVQISSNAITGFQFGILVEHGDRAEISGNTIDSGAAAAAIVQTEFHGIVIVNGSSARITGNSISNFLFGVWACGLKGQASGNSLSGNLAGIILCNVPPDDLEISGDTTGSQVPGAQWHVVDNSASSNTWAYLVIDRANNNVLANNSASGSGLYDIELTGDSYRFGFLTPACYSNVVAQGSHKGLVIKDCGHGNVISGDVTLVDNGSDPCF